MGYLLKRGPTLGHAEPHLPDSISGTCWALFTRIVGGEEASGRLLAPIVGVVVQVRHGCRSPILTVLYSQYLGLDPSFCWCYQPSPLEKLQCAEISKDAGDTFVHLLASVLGVVFQTWFAPACSQLAHCTPSR